ncbi:MAG: antirestriction protein [Pelagibacterium sp. SCN 63-23]|nr:MAG: antirestriction protein [Pelagibacterium sp. SCN 63-23]
MTIPGTQYENTVLVPEARREGFLPELFGRSLLIVGENTVYSLMEWLSPQDYGGGFWNFYEYRGSPLFLAPTSKPRFRIACPTNDYQGEVSAEAAGIIATLFAFSHLSLRYRLDRLADGYERLYGHAGEHPEAAEIFQAID